MSYPLPGEPHWFHAWSGARRVPLTPAQRRPFNTLRDSDFDYASAERCATRRLSNLSALNAERWAGTTAEERRERMRPVHEANRAAAARARLLKGREASRPCAAERSGPAHL